MEEKAYSDWIESCSHTQSGLPHAEWAKTQLLTALKWHQINAYSIVWVFVGVQYILSIASSLNKSGANDCAQNEQNTSAHIV